MHNLEHNIQQLRCEAQEQAGELPIITEHLHFVDNADGTYLALNDNDLKYFSGIVKNCADPHTPSSWEKAMEGPNC